MEECRGPAPTQNVSSAFLLPKNINIVITKIVQLFPLNCATPTQLFSLGDKTSTPLLVSV